MELADANLHREQDTLSVRDAGGQTEQEGGAVGVPAASQVLTCGCRPKAAFSTGQASHTGLLLIRIKHAGKDQESLVLLQRFSSESSLPMLTPVGVAPGQGGW